jgi:Raf kinase inhibitor-like YbhB/YbcL family protein
MARHPGRFRPLLAVLAVTALAVVAAACGTSGRSMQEPEPGATAPPRRPDITTTTAGAGVNTLIPSDLFTLASPAFAGNDAIPTEYSCDGAGGSPPLTWGNVAPGTVELALLVTDPDADGFIHWMVAGIDPAITGMAAGAAPAGAVQLKNSAGTVGYTPMCPPAGPSHTYEFTLYALDAPSGLTPASDTRTAAAQVASTAKSIAVLTGTYARTTAN